MESAVHDYWYIHPEHICATYQGMESGDRQVLFACPLCEGKASFSVPKRVGSCFVCGIVIKLHSRYEGIPIDTLLSELPIDVSFTPQRESPSPDRVDLVTRPLSPSTWDYIASRGIDRAIVERFGLLEETTYYGQTYLAWPTSAGDYELRAIRQIDTRWEKITPRGHHKHFSLVNHTPRPTTCIVCEGLFSALAYAQLLPQDDAWYVILNSISNGTKFLEALATFTTAGIGHFVLALDNDQAGHEARRGLTQALEQAGVEVESHYPPGDGDDWNDVLQRGDTIHTSPTVGAPGGSVTIEAPPAVPAAPATALRPLDVHYYEQILTQYGKVVVAAPCGTGKTTAAADLIAQCWREGVLYVAERVDQLRAMQALLLQREVPPDVIGLYVYQSADLRALQQEQITKPIALLTHARMQLYAPQAYGYFPRHGGMATRRLLIVDESIAPLLILSAPRLFIEGLLRHLGLTWTDLGTLDADTIDQKLHAIDALLTLHAHAPLERVGIRYQGRSHDRRSDARAVEVRRYAYYQMLYQILAGHYRRCADGIAVLVPMVPHLTWYQLFPQILVLDATATLTDFLYPDYQILTPRAWNYGQITEAYKVHSSLGNLTKRTILTHQDMFLQELKDHVVPFLTDFPDPYIVTYKQVEASVQTVLQRPVHHYGMTRGSNAYRTTDAAVLLGAYRPPVAFDELARLYFGARYSHVKMVVAHWIQECYRTRIRSDEPIKLLVMGEQEAIGLLQTTLQIPFWPLVIAGIDNPDIGEKILGRIKSKVQQALLRQLLQAKVVDMQAFAREYTNYDRSKVIRAMRGILQQYPRFQGHIVVDETTVRLIDKPAPRR